ncbi:src kinase-associated phosphoprotein 1 isoform X2 [Nelusetta ayraudi]|uniref:src kinase-associated phosphoprotein 1 isoform X2 n=1 Tax=Nelusetta ayraudi TaxID=303726 RepID=UPI003F70F85C
MGTVPHDIRRLLNDCKLFVSEILQDEELTENAQDTRRVLLNNFRVVHARNPQEFPYLEFKEDDGSDDNRSSSLGRSVQSDNASLASDNQDDGAPEYFGDIPPVAAQDVINVLKQGYLDKKRKDPSFFGAEWQKRWCVLNDMIFYYYGTDKDKHQKGSLYISDYDVQLVNNLRKDSKKNCCFELFAPGRRSFQFTASGPQEASEWVEQIKIVLRDLSSSLILEEEEEEEEPYDDIEQLSGPPLPHPVPGLDTGDEEDEDIYEVLPEEDFLNATDEGADGNSVQDYANYYQCLWDCTADEADELDFQRGDLVYIISKEYNIHGWWVGELNGAVGIVPKDYLHPAYIL